MLQESCYKLFPEEMTHLEAEQFCANNGSGLLSNETTPMHHRSTTNQNDNGSIYTENIDLSSPGFNNRNIVNEPPRNIFDDI